MSTSCGKHEGPCDVLVTFSHESPLMRIGLHEVFEVAGTPMRVTGWDTIPAGADSSRPKWRELHCELVP